MWFCFSELLRICDLIHRNLPCPHILLGTRLNDSYSISTFFIVSFETQFIVSYLIHTKVYLYLTASVMFLCSRKAMIIAAF